MTMPAVAVTERRKPGERSRVGEIKRLTPQKIARALTVAGGRRALNEASASPAIRAARSIEGRGPTARI